jgi:cytoskeletal protein CcmA (bactofilin family)
VVEEGTEFKGALTSSCPIDVRGRVEGDVATPALTVSTTGAVHGRFKVGSVRSEGELSGEFDAESVELAGKVRDNTVIRARSLEVKLSSSAGRQLQVIFGECELSIGEEPTEKDNVEPVAEPAPAEQPMAAVAAEASPEPAPNAEASAADEEGEEEGEEDGAVAADGSAPAGGKRKKKRKNGQQEETPQGGWTQPPSQPPPAN